MDIQPGNILDYSEYAIIKFNQDNQYQIIARIILEQVVQGLFTGRIIETTDNRLYKMVRLNHIPSDYQHYDYVPENQIIRQGA